MQLFNRAAQPSPSTLGSGLAAGQSTVGPSTRPWLSRLFPPQAANPTPTLYMSLYCFIRAAALLLPPGHSDLIPSKRIFARTWLSCPIAPFVFNRSIRSRHITPASHAAPWPCNR